MHNVRLFLFILLAVFCVADLGAAAYGVEIEGVVLSRKGPVADGVVTAYPDYASLRSRQHGVVSSPGEKTGQYRLSLPPGKHYLVATGTEKGIPLYGYHGLNPVLVEEAGSWIPILVLPENQSRCEAGPEGVGGYVLYNGEPAAGSSISVYALSDEPFRGMGLLTNTVAEDGSFWFDLEPGSYVVIARKRAGGGAIGPIQKGDLLCYFSANPIQVPPGTFCELEISCYPRDDLDAFFAQGAADPRGKKEEKRRAASLREADETDSTRQVVGGGRRPAFVSGRVTDPAGLPLSELYISAYPAAEVPLFQMYVLRLKTEYMTRTDAKGFFRLELGSGTYYLVAREKVGDAPLAGEYYGIYEGSPNHSFTVKAGEVVSGVHIIAETIMP